MRTRRTKEQIRKDIYNKDVDAYNFYVVNLDTMKAETGFEFKEDAVDVLNDYDDKKKYKVVSKKSLKSLGIENPNESFKYAGGGNVKPFEYKENNSTIMINGTKADVKEMYLDYVNNFLSVSRFAEYYNISERQANSIIESGRKYAKEDGYYAGGGEFSKIYIVEYEVNGNKKTSEYLLYENDIVEKMLPSNAKIISIKEKMATGGGVGKVKWQDVEVGDSARVKEINKMGVILKTYGRKFHLKFPNGTEKTFDASELEFIISGNDKYADGGVTNNYVSRRNLNTITIKKGNQKLTYKISDVLNGAYKLESGAKLEDIAFYVPKRSIVKVQLKTGKDFKPANGYWIKDGAKPIHVTKFDDGGNLDGVNPYQNINSIRERYELLNDMYSNEQSNVDYTDILKVGDVVYGDDIQGYARIYKEVNDPEKGDYFIFQDRFDDRFAFYIIQSIRSLRSKELFLQNVGISEEDFLYSPEVININKDLNFAKGRVRLYEKNPNNASNYHGINYNDYISASSQIKPLEENLRLMLKEERHKFDEGGNVQPFEYEEKKSITITNATKEDIQNILFDLINEKYSKIKIGNIVEISWWGNYLRVYDPEDGGIYMTERKQNIDSIIEFIITISKREGQNKIIGIKEPQPQEYKFDEGGVMSRLLTRKKDQPKVETTDEDIDLNEDSRIRVRPSSFVRKDKEGDWMMKKNSSKEARSYAGGGEIRVGDKVKVKASGIGEDYAIVTGIDSLNDVLKRNDDPNTYLSIKDSKGYNWEIYLKEVVEFPSKTKLSGGGRINKDVEIDSNIQNFIKKIKDKGKYSKGNEQKNTKGILYRFDEYKLINPSRFELNEFKRLVVKSYGVLSLSNGYDSNRINLEENKVIYANIPSAKGGYTDFITYRELVKLNKEGGKVSFSEKAKAIAKNFEGKRVEPKYQKEYGKVYDKKEAKEVGNKIAGSQKASYDAKLEKGSEVKKGKGNHKMKATTDLARKIRKDGEKWTDAIKRASLQLK